MNQKWPARYFVPDAMRDYCMSDASSRGFGFGAIVSGAGGLYPKTIRVDQGSEFISRDLDLWAYANGVILDFSRPGKPTGNAFIEAFNSKVRGQCLNAHWFMSLDDARSKLEDWPRYYNEERLHSGIGQITPILLHKPSAASSPSLAKEAENSGVR